MALCVGVSNPLRENCFTTLTSSVFRGAHSLKQEQVMGFCTDPLLEDAGPVSCLQVSALVPAFVRSFVENSIITLMSDISDIVLIYC